MRDLLERLFLFTLDGAFRATFPGLRILKANRGLVRMLDLDCGAAELEGQRLGDLFAAEDADRAVFDQLVRDREIHGFEHQIRTCSGQIRWLEYSAYVMDDPETGQTVVEALIRDVSGPRAARARQLDEAERRGRILNTLPDILFELDRRGVFVDYHASDPTMLFVPPEAFLGRGVDEVLPPHIARLTRESMARAFETGEMQVYEYSVGEGELEAHYEARLVAYAEDEVMAIVRDITDRKRAEAAREQSEQRFRDIAHTMADLIWEVDAEGRYVYVSPKVQGLLGYDPTELIGQPPFTLLEEADAKLAEDRFRDCAEAGKPLRNFEVTAVHRTGELVRLQLNAVPVFDKEGRVEGFRGVSTNVTERRRMEEEALRREKLESLGVLAGGMAHEFNNLLTALTGNIALARTQIPDGTHAHIRLLAAEKALGRARDLTKRLLVFARGGAPVLRAATIGELVRESVSFAMTGSRAHLEISIADDLLPAAVDQGQLRQVLQNLVINADQAMPHGGVVKVRARNVVVDPGSHEGLDAGRYVRIDVTDEGIGIEPHDRERMFDPFFSTKASGSGLGLSVSYSVVRKHGGQILVDSTPGQGSVFSIYLPASREQCQPNSEGGSPEPDRVRILVMDDDGMIQDLAGAVLVSGGYDVTVTADGGAAVQAYRDARVEGRPYAVVVLDLVVPGGMGGLDANQLLLETDPGALTIVSSGYSNDPVMAEYASHGFSAVVAKPYHPTELLEAVRALLERH